jgi:hypothetical protein
MNERQHTFRASQNRAATWRTLSTSDGGAAADLVVVALVAIDQAISEPFTLYSRRLALKMSQVLETPNSSSLFRLLTLDGEAPLGSQ